MKAEVMRKSSAANGNGTPKSATKQKRSLGNSFNGSAKKPKLGLSENLEKSLIKSAKKPTMVELKNAKSPNKGNKLIVPSLSPKKLKQNLIKQQVVEDSDDDMDEPILKLHSDEIVDDESSDEDESDEEVADEDESDADESTEKVAIELKEESDDESTEEVADEDDSDEEEDESDEEIVEVKAPVATKKQNKNDSKKTCFNCKSEGHISANCKSPVKNRKCFNCDSTEHTSSKCDKPTKKRVCFKCGSKDHVIANCKNDKRLCYKCNSTNHTAAECKNKKKGRTGKKSCYKCGSIDHILINCPKNTTDAKGCCFNCGSPDHIKVNCPKSQSDKSKNQGSKTVESDDE